MFCHHKKEGDCEFNFDDNECKTSMKRCNVADLLIFDHCVHKRQYYARSTCVIGVEGIGVLVEVLIQNVVSIRY